ncbi:unnamed protein product [Arctogadus glacialis]
MEQVSPKNTDHGKTTTTSRIMDNGKTQQQTKNADNWKGNDNEKDHGLWHEGCLPNTLVGGGGPGGVGEDSAGGMLSEGEIEETPEEERDQIRKSWMEEMDVETVSEADEPMDRKERKAELLKKRKAKKERIVVAKKKGLRTRTSHSLPSAIT